MINANFVDWSTRNKASCGRLCFFGFCGLVRVHMEIKAVFVMKHINRKTAVIAAAVAAALLAAGADDSYANGSYATPADYSGHWAEQLAVPAIREGLLQGYENGLYGPDRAITRAELAVLLARVLPLETAAAALPEDAADGSWYAEAVRQTAAAGLLTTDEEGRFRPGAPVTRLDAAVVLGRLLGWSGEGGAWPEAIIDREAAPDQAGGRWLAQAAADGYIAASSEGYILPYRPWTRSEALYALLKTRGAAADGVRPAAFAAVQALEGVVRDTGSGFTLTAAQTFQGTVTESVYALSSGKSLAGTKAAAGTDGLAVRITGINGLVPPPYRLVVDSISLQAASASPDKLEGILLEGHHSTTASPPDHKKLCLLMPDCAASGFGVSVLQEDGSYIYYKFDETGHRLAVILLDSIAAADHVGIRVEGHIAGDVIHVSRLSQTGGALEAAKETSGSSSTETHEQAAEAHEHPVQGHDHSAQEHDHSAPGHSHDAAGGHNS